MIKELKNNESDINKLKVFINKIDSNFFRYFDSRDISCISNHKYTIVYEFENNIVGYAHIDYDGDNWLGICVLDGHRRRGIGHELMNKLIDFHNNFNKGEYLYLTVDTDNPAKYLYEKFGFEIDNIVKDTVIKMKYKNCVN